MLRNNRVLYFRQGAFRDYSTALSDINAQTKVLDYTSPGDFLYIGSDFPFNHRYFDLSVFNSVAAVVSVDLWSGNEWVPAVDVLDETSSAAGVPLAQSGIISWQPDLDRSSWSYDDTDEMAGSGLETAPVIYKLYWARLKWTATLTATTAVNYVGHKFSDDLDLEAEYPELASSSIKLAWKAAKTDWKEQALTAAEYIVQDLRGIKDLITSASQVLDWKNFQKASVHRTAMIIFRGFGDDYKDQLLDAHNAYKSSLNAGKYNLDIDKDANLSDLEKTTNSRYATR